MSDDYLWDRTGLPEADELQLETLLGPLRLRSSGEALGAPAPAARGLSRRVVFGALAAAACVAVGFWLGGRQTEGRDMVADGRAPIRSEAVPPVPKPEPAWAAAPGGSGSREVLDPWGNERRPSPRRQVSQDGEEPSSAGEPSRQGVIDPWGAGPPVPSAQRPARAPRGSAPHNELMDPWRTRPQSTGGQSGAGLRPAAIQRVVKASRTSLANACWKPALDRSARDAPPTARVAVTLLIGPDGRVLRASHDGQPAGYPGLAPCLVSEVLRWRFPRSDGRTAASVPLVFARQ